MSVIGGIKHLGGVPNIEIRTVREVLQRTVVIFLLERHWVIADGVVDDVMRVRDPRPEMDGDAFGIEAQLGWDDFVSCWRRGQYQMVWRQE